MRRAVSVDKGWFGIYSHAISDAYDGGAAPCHGRGVMIADALDGNSIAMRVNRSEPPVTGPQ